MIAQKPIQFTGQMVSAVFANLKTETRRLVRPQPPTGWDRHCWFDAPLYGWTREPEPAGDWHTARCPYGAHGDLLWVREEWGVFDRGSVDPFEAGEVLPSPFTSEYAIAYRATEEDPNTPATWVEAPSGHRILAADDRWRRSRYMPKWACRLWLRVEDVRVERLHEISPEGAEAEGFPARWTCLNPGTGSYAVENNPVDDFRTAWDAFNSKRAPWSSDPWVWVVTFSRTEAPDA